MTRILIINESSTDNLGDQMIAAGMEYLIREFFPNNIVITIPFTYIGKVQNCIPSDNVLISCLKGVIRVLKLQCIVEFIECVRWTFSFWLPQYRDVVRISPDHVIFSGGPVIDRYSKHLVSLMLWSLIFGGMHRRPLAAFGIDCSQGIPLIRRALFRLALKRVRPIFVRSVHARDRLDVEIGVPSSQTRCPAFLSRRMHPESTGNRTYAVFSPCSYSVYVGLIQRSGKSVMSEADYTLHCLAELAAMRLRFSNVIMATTVKSQDGPFIEKLAKASGSLHATDGYPLAPDSINELLSLLAGASYVHSGRLHMLIPAYAMGAKCVGFPRVGKIAEFMDEVADQNIPISEICNGIEADFLEFVASLRA